MIKLIDGDLLKPVLNIEEYNESTEDARKIDLAARAYADVVVKLGELAEMKSTLVQILNDAAGVPDKVRGTITLVGDEIKVKVTRSQSATYKKDEKDSAPFLQTLFEVVPEFRGALSVTFKEKPAAMDKLLQAVAAGTQQFDVDDEQLAEILAIIEEVGVRRVVKDATPQIKVEPV